MVLHAAVRHTTSHPAQRFRHADVGLVLVKLLLAVHPLPNERIPFPSTHPEIDASHHHPGLPGHQLPVYPSTPLRHLLRIDALPSRMYTPCAIPVPPVDLPTAYYTTSYPFPTVHQPALHRLNVTHPGTRGT